jgi:hypothetical protein
MRRASMARPTCRTIVDGGLLIAPDKESWELLRREVFTV